MAGARDRGKSAEWIVALKQMDYRPSQGFYFFFKIL